MLDEARRAGHAPDAIACEILSTQPYPLRRVIERHGMGRFRVTQKADLACEGDGYRGENARPEDWIMLGNHDTATIWERCEAWVATGRSREQAAYLASRLLAPGEGAASRERWIAAAAGDAGELAQARLADLFVGPARQVLIAFTDLFGFTERYNAPGDTSSSNWSLRLPPGFPSLYASRLAEARALESPARAHLRASRARARRDLGGPRPRHAPGDGGRARAQRVGKKACRTKRSRPELTWRGARRPSTLTASESGSVPPGLGLAVRPVGPGGPRNGRGGKAMGTSAGRDDELHLPPRRPPRVVVEAVSPQVERGRFPVKRTVGEEVVVEADVYTEGHDLLTAVLRYRRESETSWHELEMKPLVNDRWRAAFPISALEGHRYTVAGWADPFRTWRAGLAKKLAAGQVELVDVLVGAELVLAAATRAEAGPGASSPRGEPADAARLRELAGALRSAESPLAGARAALGDELALLVARHPDRSDEASFEAELRVEVERERARYTTWYELFPRSASPEPGRHGTLRDVAARLPYVAGMGFDVLYLPPIHPIGTAYRKGKNNSPVAGPDDVGSPWAIGSPGGGHDAIHPCLGTMDDFRHLVAEAGRHGLEIALDLALQCSPNHPWVTEHPEWFRRRPDGSIQYAENPPKKYQDIYPIDFETEAWRELWAAILAVVEGWVREGVRVFRVDNPHTKAFRFWEWLIAEVRRSSPEVMFLAEAFTRPKVMYHLAKLGFSQSYTYFTWRNTKAELTAYLRELTQGPPREFFRPSFWPNTPDILPEHLQYGGRATFQARLVLAATLSASYGIYGPSYELMEHRAREPGTEEQADSEKYEVRHWDLEQDSLRDYIARVNRIRRENPALQRNDRLEFHAVDNDQLIAYSKSTGGGEDVVLTVVNLDPHHVHSGWVELPVERLGIPAGQPFQLHDLLGGARYFWQGPRNFVQLDPHASPAHIFRIRRRLKTERDFDYFF